jgi:hypothetical protein
MSGHFGSKPWEGKSEKFIDSQQHFKDFSGLVVKHGQSPMSVFYHQELIPTSGLS